MFLSDADIKEAMASRRIGIVPHPVEQALGPCSIDLRLAGEFRLPWLPDSVVYKHEFIIPPGRFVLASTIEIVELADDIAAIITGRSSFGRQGLYVTGDSSMIPAGWKGQITLELKNVGHEPVILPIGVRICQLAFVPLTSPAEFPYGSKSHQKYFGQRGPTNSRFADHEKYHNMDIRGEFLIENPT